MTGILRGRQGTCARSWWHHERALAPESDRWTRHDPYIAQVHTQGSGPEVDGRRRRSVGWHLTLLVGLAVLGTVQKLPCLRGAVDTDTLATAQCYSDIPLFYVGRGLAADIGWFGGLPPGFGDLEYPPLINLFIEATAKATHLVMGIPSEALTERAGMSAAEIYVQAGMAAEERTFFILSAAGLLAAALVAVYAAGRAEWSVGSTTTWLMAAPLIVLTFAVNWDLPAIAFAVLAVIAWDRRRWPWFGALVALGTATKLFPLVLLAAAYTLLTRDRQWRSAAKATVGFAAVWLTVNLPLFLTDREGWSTFWVSNSERSAYFGSLWMSLRMLGVPTTSQQLSLVLAGGVLVTWCALTAATWLRILRPTLLELATALMLVFFMVGKVYSPQYSLWVMLAVLATVSARWLVGAVAVAETFHYVATWLYIRGITTPEAGIDKTYLVSIALRLVGEGLVVLYILWITWRRAVDDRGTEAQAPSRTMVGT